MNGQLQSFQATDVFKHIEAAEGRIWVLPDGVSCFAGDLPEHEQKVVWAVHYPPAADLFDNKMLATAWNSKPNWFIVANNDRTVHPELQRFAAKHMKATIHAVDSSHVPMLSQPGFVTDVNRSARPPGSDEHPLRKTP